ncbi:hypothetical protein P3T40_004720 [Paraburkholderia sp. EB58]|jgi:hypothetical protein
MTQRPDLAFQCLEAIASDVVSPSRSTLSTSSRSRVQASTKVGRFSFVAVHPGAAPHARVNWSMSALKEMSIYFC